MKQYIDKSAVVAKIRHLQLCTMDEHMSYYSSKAKAEYDILNELLLHLDNLEVKEVDLDREIRRYRMRNPIIQHREESLYDYMANAAKYFFELGMSVRNKSQKGE